MSQNVLLTGPYGRCGTAIIDHLHDRDDYEFTYLNRSDRSEDHPYGRYDTVVADIANYEAIRPAFDGQDAVVHLAAYPYTDGNWGDILRPNIIGMNNVLEAAREAEVETVVFGSSNHVVGRYELENAPDIYDANVDFTVDHTDPVRPDSYYGTSKAFGEDLGRYFVETHEYPKRFYALRICSVRHEEYDHPYGDAEKAVETGEYERGTPEYREAVARMKAMWQSRRDFAHMVECCLEDTSVEFDVFYGVSDNERRWFDIDHAREVLGYDPRDDGGEWDSPPEHARE
ncbi:NAD-dependent epimerase/dehydratase family protein [Halorussus salinisoli]|uniref:NAD-dependent epimerase/dehydratase family protein n=1 Tax=Halorussus salinisoli TaxID=2558242 RepID=UPI0010C21A6F|nr:NAD(P)-dependent oxidoreductase [Halorussus salinisoli]